MNSVIICDLDGTLIDSRSDLTTGVNLMRAEYGLSSLSLETVTNYVGNGTRKLAERALTGTDIDIDEALAKIKKHYQAHMIDQTKLYPTVLQGLQLIKKKGYKTAVCTNKPHEPCLAILKKLGVADYFNVILGATAKYTLKPDPAMLHAIMKQTEAETAGSWMVGDNYTDLESGRRAGLKNCFANYGFGYQNDESYDLKVESFAEFAEYLPNISESIHK